MVLSVLLSLVHSFRLQNRNDLNNRLVQMDKIRFANSCKDIFWTLHLRRVTSVDNNHNIQQGNLYKGVDDPFLETQSHSLSLNFQRGKTKCTIPLSSFPFPISGPDNCWLMQQARDHYLISGMSLSCSLPSAAPHLSPSTVLVIGITVMPVAEAGKWIIEQQ